MRLKGGTPTGGLVLEEVLKWLTHTHHGQRLPAACQALGAGDDVRNHAFKMLEGKQTSRATETRHHLVTNHENAILVAERTDTFHEAHSRNENSRGARDALHHDGCDGGGTFGHNLFLQAGQGHFTGLLVGVAPAKEMWFRVEHLHKPRGRVLREAAAKVPSGTKGRQGSAVVAAVLVEDLGLSCVEACEADGAVVGFTPAGGEEETIEIARRQFRQQR
mmetsp:Transcript_74742/g.165038  ORF Transcript_74742/g.165038 Transcript_74742/m.165038 type:complete len:219 (-) Transcript_74742:547-1203(-)